MCSHGLWEESLDQDVPSAVAKEELQGDEDRGSLTCPEVRQVRHCPFGLKIKLMHQELKRGGSNTMLIIA